MSEGTRDTMKFIRKLASCEAPDSLSCTLRRERFEVFKALIRDLPKPTRIIDVGGTQIFWENVGFCHATDIECTIVNIDKIITTHLNFCSVVADGKCMAQFRDAEFDIAFSNSCIQVLGEGGFEDQRRMAEEIRRVGKRYFVQTPNKSFPIDPHALLPFFHWLPLPAKVWLVTHFRAGWGNNIPDKADAIRSARRVRMLNRRELQELFPDGTIANEKMFGLTKSMTIYNVGAAMARTSARCSAETKIGDPTHVFVDLFRGRPQLLWLKARLIRGLSWMDFRRATMESKLKWQMNSPRMPTPGSNV